MNLGVAGLKVSAVCMGTMSFGNSAWQVDLPRARKLIDKAVEFGINFFDTANMYSEGNSEEILGECLKGYQNDVVVATKVGYRMGKGSNDLGLGRRHIIHQIRASLKRLQMDHIDLYQVHRWDPEVPIEETMRTMNDLVRNGLVHYIGASSMLSWQFAKALYTSERIGLEKFVSMQNHYNLVYREEEREMIPLCKQESIAILPWSPLARGFLTGRYKRGQHPRTARYENDPLLGERYFKPEDFDVLEAVETLSHEKGLTPAQVSLAWLLHKSVTAPVIGVTRIEHIEDAVSALEVKLEAEDLQRLEAPYRPHPMIGFDGFR